MRKAIMGSLIRTVLIGVPMSVAFLDCVAYVAQVDGISMQPALNPEDGGKSKDIVLLNRWSVKDFKLTRGDIVSLSSPRDPDQKIIKRVIGLEGDTIKTMGYKQRYVQVPQGHCWVEGDHHKHSMDSNFFGPVALGLVTARASHIVWPPARWQRLDTKVPRDRGPPPAQPDVFRTFGRSLDEAEDVDALDVYLSSMWADGPRSSS